MKLRTAASLTATVALACTLTTLGGAPAQAAPGHRSLATVLAADGHHFDHDWSDFDIVDKAVLTVLAAKPSSPVSVLTTGSVRLTAFLPTDAAFRRLVRGLTGVRPGSERATFTRLAHLVDIDTLEAVLLYHVVPGATLTAAKAVKADGASLTTAAGPTVTVDVRKRGIVLIDQDPDARNPRVVQPDINKGNRQVAHGIDRVLRPLDL